MVSRDNISQGVPDQNEIFKKGVIDQKIRISTQFTPQNDPGYPMSSANENKTNRQPMANKRDP